MSRGALDGIVIDFSRVLAGPYATMMLGDYGAEGIKVERPGVGDGARAWGQPYDALGVDTAGELVAGADIVVENFRPGTMEKLGLGYEDAHRITPDLIYCSITGFGRDGGAAMPGYDLLVQAGEGQRVDTNLLSSLLSSMVNQASGSELIGQAALYQSSCTTG